MVTEQERIATLEQQVQFLEDAVKRAEEARWAADMKVLTLERENMELRSRKAVGT